MVELILAVPGVLLLQVPPAGVLFNVVVPPRQAIRVPPMVVGNAVTVTIRVE